MPVFKLTSLLVMIAGYCVLTMCQAHNYCNCCHFTRMLGGTVIYHILQEETDVHRVQVTFFPRITGSARWLLIGLKPSGFRVHILNQPLPQLLFKNVPDSVREKTSSLPCCRRCTHKQSPSQLPMQCLHQRDTGARPTQPFPREVPQRRPEWELRLPADTFPLRLNTVHLTASVTSDAHILHISPPPVFYYGVKFPSWAWREMGKRENLKWSQNLRA